MFAVIVFVLFLLDFSSAQGCQITLDPEKHDPIIALTSDFKQLNPESANLDILINEGDKLLIGCTSGILTYGNKNGTIIEATCVSGTNFKVNGTTTSLNPLFCSKYSSSTARFNNETCEENGKEIEIGFNLNGSFIKIITICFDDVLKNPLYSHYHLSPKVEFSIVNVPRPTFAEGKFYNLDEKVNDLYSRTSEKTTINSLVGLNSSSTKYIKDTSDYYLARGHLTAKTDFVWESQQRATFYYVNAVPQWQNINAGNWKTIEDNVRDYSVDQSLDLEVYTGPYGISTLPHENTEEPIELYLYIDENNNKAIPIPELTWKLVYNPKNKDNIIIFTANNPYIEEIQPICTDISEEINWFTWSKDDPKKGLSYACNTAEVKNLIPYLPDLDFGDLLK